MTTAKKTEKKSKEDLIKIAHARRMQRLILMGEWLEKYEQQLKVVQGVFGDAISDWYEDNSEHADNFLVQRILDSIHLYLEVGRALRVECFCPDTKKEGILYMHEGIKKDEIYELVNIKELG